MALSVQCREPFNGLSHLFGAFMAVAGTVVLVNAARHSDQAIGFAVYGACLVFVYLASALYHLVPGDPRRIEDLRLLDHCAIYFGIAGTYTPILQSLPAPVGQPLLRGVWAVAILAGLVRLAWRAMPDWVDLVLYLGMGWVAVLTATPIVQTFSAEAWTWVLRGGVVYTVGAVVFASKRPRLWPGRFGPHELWHLFALGGSACHYILMLKFVAR